MPDLTLGQLLLLIAPGSIGEIVFAVLWLRADARAYEAERERDDLWDNCTCHASLQGENA